MGLPPLLLNPRLVVVDTTSHQVTREISVELPHDPRYFGPRFWKLPWSEELVIVSKDQLFTVNLNSGQQGETIILPYFDDRSRIPKNLPQFVEVHGGDIAPP